MYRSTKHKKRFWLMKSEPDDYSISDLKRAGVGQWEGVRNYQVRNMFRDVMNLGDTALFYHSNARIIGCVGVMEIVSEAYVDKTQFDSSSKYFDAKASTGASRWLCVDVRFLQQFQRTVQLAEIKNDPALSSMLVAQRGGRLSVTPVHERHFKRIIELGNKT